MRDIQQEELDKLFSIIPPYPGVSIFHMSDEGVDCCQKINHFCQQRDYLYHIVSVDETFVEALKSNGIVQARKITYKQQRYNQHSRIYDFIYIDIDVEKLEKPELFLKKIYAIAKNAAKILFFVPKDQNGFENLERLLDQGNFVAVNPIDDMFANHQVLSAQKMHGWGVYDM